METDSLTPNPIQVRILIIDDDAVDRIRLERMLKGIDGWVVKTDMAVNLATGLEKLKTDAFDCVLLDYRLPDGSGLELLEKISANKGDCPPIIMQTTMGHGETALRSLELGAQDYLVKDRFDAALLQRSIEYSLQRDKLVKARNQLFQELQEALAKVKTLSGLLPICCSCKKVRDDKGYWEQIENYVTKHSDASFSHGYCPDCYERFLEENQDGDGPPAGK